MASINIHTPARLTNEQVIKKNEEKLGRFEIFADNQSSNRTVWFLVSLVAQGVLFLPIPAALMYYYNAPVLVLIITLALFFANIIAGMGGSGIRTLIGLFALSIVVHLLMLAVFIL